LLPTKPQPPVIKIFNFSYSAGYNIISEWKE